MAYKLIYNNPLIDYIRNHVRLCTVLLYSKASSLCYLLTVGWYTVACEPNHDGIKAGLLYNNVDYVM